MGLDVKPMDLLNIYIADTQTYNTIPVISVDSVKLTVKTFDSNRKPIDLNANSQVQVYLVDKTKTYEPVNLNYTDEESSSNYAKGLSGPIEWIVVTLYQNGYKPDIFFDQSGVVYPSYGPFIMNADSDGKNRGLYS